MESAKELQKKLFASSATNLLSSSSQTFEGFFQPPKFERKYQNSFESPDAHQQTRVKLPDMRESPIQTSVALQMGRSQPKSLLHRTLNKSTDFSSKQKPESNSVANEILHNTQSRSRMLSRESRASLSNLSYENLSPKDLADFQKKHVAGLLTPVPRTLSSTPTMFEFDVAEPYPSNAGLKKTYFQDLENSFNSQKQMDQSITLSTDESASQFEKPRTSNPTKLVHQNLLSNSLRFYWYHNSSEPSEALKPHCREGATLTSAGQNIFLYGGRANGISCEIMGYRARKGVWKRIAATGEVPKEGRAYHTAVECNNQIYIFGGQLEKSSHQNRPCLSNEVFKFDPQKSSWKLVPVQGTLIEPRKAHAACIYEQAMIVYGGIDQYNRYLDDVWAYHLSKLDL